MARTKILRQGIRTLLQAKSGKIHTILAFNYHRIGNIDPLNPYHAIHTIDYKLFRQQIKWLSWLGNFIALDKIQHSQVSNGLHYILTFDDVSRTVLSTQKHLEQHTIPYAICPCTEITHMGFGIADKLNFVLRYGISDEILAVAQRLLNKGDFAVHTIADIRQIIKADQTDPQYVEQAFIDPLLHQSPVQPCSADQAYLSWQDIKHHFLQNPLATIVNHGQRHLNFHGHSTKAIEEDITNSIDDFKRNLQFQPKYFAVPYGKYTPQLATRLTNILASYGYQAILWVKEATNVFKTTQIPTMVQLLRIHTPTTLARFVKILLWSLGQQWQAA